jgi:hypothetical protein
MERHAGVTEGVMKIAIVLYLLAVAAAGAWAQDTPTAITVKQSSVSGDVIVVTVQIDGKTQELHCNKSTLFCAVPEPGSYLMVRLPKNRGIYECSNVDLYEKSAVPQSDSKVGEYCLVEK